MGRKGDGSVSFEHVTGTPCREPRYHRRCRGRWRGIVDMGRDDHGKRRTRKISAATRAEAQARLDDLRAELARGVRPRAGYTVADAVTDWYEHGLAGLAAKTVSTYKEVLDPLAALLGHKLLTDLSSDDVRRALVSYGGTRSSRAVAMARGYLIRAIGQAMASDLVGRNVAMLVSAPPGRAPGRPSKSLTVEQARKLIHAAQTRESRLHAYILLCLTTGIRTEEARALCWTEVDLNEPSIAVYRSVRARGDVKTRKSRRKIMLPEMAAQAMDHQEQQQKAERAAAGARWKEHGLVFTSKTGTPLDAAHVRRAFKDVTEAAGLGRDWTPRELRTSFVSVMSESGAPIEQIARLVGHSTTSTTESVYRKQINPAAMSGTEILDQALRPLRKTRRTRDAGATVRPS
jgi:integrase